MPNTTNQNDEKSPTIKIAENAIAIHPLVHKYIAELTPLMTEVAFPPKVAEDEKQSALTENDYTQFFSKLQEKFAGDKRYFSTNHKKYTNLTLTTPTAETLKGLTKFAEHNQDFCFDGVTLAYEDGLTDETFDLLKKLLKQLSGTSLKSLAIDIPKDKLDANQKNKFDELANFCLENNISATLILPHDLKNGKKQQALDICAANQQRRNRIESQAKVSDNALPITEQTRVVINDVNNVEVDVELEQDYQIQRQVEVSHDFNNKVKTETDKVANSLDQDEFVKRVTNDLEINGKKVPLQIRLLTEQQLRMQWDIWFGNPTLDNRGFGYPPTERDSVVYSVSQIACEQLLQHHEQFGFGLDFEKLTPGFKFDKNFLRYDAKQALLANPDLLTLQPHVSQPANTLAPEVIESWLKWAKQQQNNPAVVQLLLMAKKINNLSSYDREANELFYKHFALMATMNESELKQIDALIFLEAVDGIKFQLTTFVAVFSVLEKLRHDLSNIRNEAADAKAKAAAKVAEAAKLDASKKAAAEIKAVEDKKAADEKTTADAKAAAAKAAAEARRQVVGSYHGYNSYNNGQYAYQNDGYSSYSGSGGYSTGYTRFQDESYHDDKSDSKAVAKDAKLAIQPSSQNSLVEKVRTLSNSYIARTQRQSEPSAQHMLYIVLMNGEKNAEPNKNIIQQIKIWSDRLNLQDTDLNSLLDVYNEAGCAGLQKLFGLWEVWAKPDISILKTLQRTLFSKMQSYLPLLDSRYQQAVDLVKTFQDQGSDYKKSWWEILLVNHCQFAGEDDLHALALAFDMFCKEIKALGLKLYKPERFLYPLCNMPVALNRILTLLKRCPKDDLVTQWHDIPKISLQSNATACALSAKAYRVHLVVPEMQVTPDKYDYKHGYLDSSESLERSFYRDISAYSHHLPIAFYREAVKVIKDSKEDQKYFYGFLTKATTGINAEGCFANLSNKTTAEQQAVWLKQWQEICDNLRSLPMPTFASTADKNKLKNTVLNSLRDFSLLPPLHTYTTLVKMLSAGVNLGSLSIAWDSRIVTWRESNLESARDIMQKLFNRIGNAFYQGIRFYDADDLTVATETLQTYSKGQTQGFFGHVEICKKITKIHQNANAPITFADDFLIRIVSTFRITHANYEDILGKIKKIPPQDLQEISHLLDRMAWNKHQNSGWFSSSRQLNSTHLTDFLEELTAVKNKGVDEKGEANDLSPVASLVEKHFKDYYPVNFFAELRAGDLSHQDKSLLAEHFPDQQKQIIEFLLQFKHAARANIQYQEILIQLSSICKNLSIEDKRNFLQQLALPNLYQSDPTLADFQKLFAAIIVNGHPAAFIFVISNADANTSNLLQKATLYCTELAVVVDKHTGKTLQKSDCGLLATQLVVNESPEVLKTAGPVLDSKPSPVADQGYNDGDYKYDYKDHKHNSGTAPTATVSTISSAPLGYAKLIAGILQDLDKVIDNFLDLKPKILTLVHTFIDQLSASSEKTQLKLADQTKNFIEQLNKFFGLLKNSDELREYPELIRSLCVQFANCPTATKKFVGTTPGDLLAFLNQISKATPDKQAILLKMVAIWVNNNMPFDAVDLGAIVASNLLTAAELKKIYHTAPYPSAKLLIDWCKNSAVADAKISADDKVADAPVDRFSKLHNEFNLKPCKRELENSFVLNFAKARAAEFKGGEEYLDEKSLNSLEENIKKVRALPSSELKNTLEKLRNKGNYQEELLAIMAELLYRSKGKDGGAGNSFEINTTQYLALLCMLKSGGRMTSQIATGEGKSRIMMLLAACEHWLGKTVDFVTSDISLAERDYLEYQAFFNMLDAKVCLLFANSPVTSYKRENIYFTDAANLSLFRNKAHSSGESAKVITKDPTERTLLLDEADRTYFDMTNIRFNYSQNMDAGLQGMEWVYKQLMAFFADSKKVDLFKAGKLDECTNQFYLFLDCQQGDFRASKLQIRQLRALPLSQLLTWQKAAVTAQSLKLNEHFVIVKNVLENTANGLQRRSQARLLIKGHEMGSNSKYSFGVHQCLHARLNRTLEPGQQPFTVTVEKQIVYSSGTKIMLDDYAEGDLFAVTGTAGSTQDKNEAEALYSRKMDGAKMQFVEVPRHKGLLREDKPVRLLGNDTQQTAALMDYIKQARAKNQPVLIFCANENESLALFEKIKKQDQNNLQHIHSKLTPAQQQECIEKAGAGRMVTISTDMTGRGRDIRLDDAAKQHGLLTLITFLPKERDFEQMCGRSGRYGDRGETRLVLNKQALKTQLKTTTLKEGFFGIGFYTGADLYVKKQHTSIDTHDQCLHLVQQDVVDFNYAIQKNFFALLDASQLVGEQRNELETRWAAFKKQADQLWIENYNGKVTAAINAIHTIGSEKTIGIVNDHLRAYSNRYSGLWQQLFDKTKDKLQPKNNDAKHDQKTSVDMQFVGLQLSETTKKLLAGMKIAPLNNTPVYSAYDKAFDGRSVVYNKLFAELRALPERGLFANTRAWINGHGVLFADTRALLFGNRKLFANTRAWWNAGNSAPVVKAVESKQEKLASNTNLLPAGERSDSGGLTALGAPLLRKD